MNPQQKKILPIIVLQIIPLLLFPFNLLASGWWAILFMIVIFVLLGIALIRGRLWALTMSIFLQGINAVIRLMMFLPNAQNIATGSLNWSFVITGSLSIILSVWFLLRLDKPDIRSMISQKRRLIAHCGRSTPAVFCYQQYFNGHPGKPGQPEGH